MILVFLLCISLFILSFVCSKKDIIGPGVITSGIWLFCLSLFCTLHHNLPALSEQFLGALSIWVTFFCLSSLLIQSLSTKNTIGEPSKLIRDLFFWISIITYPFFIFFVRDALILGHSGSWSSDLRLAALGKTSNFKEIYGGIHVIIWQVSYMIELFYFSKKNRKRVFILGFIFLSFGFFTMSKSLFLEFFTRTIIVLYFSKKIKVKHILFGAGGLYFLMVIIQSIRNSANVDTVNSQSFTVLYLLSSMTAFGTIVPGSALHWGENVFRLFYSTSYKLGISSISPIDILLKFINKPISTNTYTIMYPFFKDFGNWGVGIFATIYGLTFGWVFKKAQNGSAFFVLIFATLGLSIITQYGGELLLTNISGYFKQIILLSIPFWATRIRLFNKTHLSN